MKLPAWITLDWETEAINARPEYPPRPVGLGIKRPGERKGKYMAFGHPTENNCTKEQAYAEFRDAVNSGQPLLFQEGKFDLEIGLKHVPGVRMPDWRLVHDTKYMLFLRNPHSTSLQLKPSAEEYLDMPATEQDELRDWVLANVRGAKKSDWGAYISLAPGKLVGKYGVGDVVRTDGLGKLLLPYLHAHNMMEAYDRERRLMPVLLENEQQGIRTAVDALGTDIKRMHEDIEVCDGWLRKRLKRKNLNVSSNAEFADALANAKIIADDGWVLTKTGRRSTSKKNLTPNMFRDKKVFQAYSHRNKLSTCVGTFAEPWHTQALTTGGYIHTEWRQVKGTGAGGDSGGARSGRCQSTPNFQNIPKNFNKKDPNYSKPMHLDVLDLPLMRRYLIPDEKNHVWGRRDYNQQELRILAHFEDGSLLQSYLDDPRYDMHQLVHDGVLDIVGLDFERDLIKAFNFQDIYGGGIPAFCNSLHCDETTARKVKQAKRALMPDVDALDAALKAMGKHRNDAGELDQPIRTWGSREYYTEPGEYVEKFGRFTTFEYKLLNYLIQGSAADCTKEALIRYHQHPKRQGRLLVAVHDEINISAHKKIIKQEMALLREVMQSVEFDAPMLSDGESGESWGKLEKFIEPAFNMAAWKAARAV